MRRNAFGSWLNGRSGIGGVPAALVTMLASLGGSAFGQCQYESHGWSPFPCGDPFFTVYTGIGLNDLGAWCGYRLGCTTETNFPVYCPPGGMPQVLPMPPGTGTDGAQALALNNNGIVVGWYRRPPWNLDSACAWLPDGRVIDLFEIGPGDRSVATAVSDSGVIVGYQAFASGAPMIVPFVWQDGGVEFIDPAPFVNGQARRVSEAGVVMGYMGNPNVDSRAFRWKSGVLELLPPAAPHTHSLGNGLNNAGVVVGGSSTYVGGSVGNITSPTVWERTKPFMLPKLSGYESAAALRINDAGVIVGLAYHPTAAGMPSQVPVLWVNGEIMTIASLLVPGSPSIGSPRELNNAGQILVSGGPRLWSPTWSSPMDLNGDCAVNGSDLGVLLASWGAPDFDVRCDFNGDGIVDGHDLGTLLGAWTIH